MIRPFTNVWNATIRGKGQIALVYKTGYVQHFWHVPEVSDESGKLKLYVHGAGGWGETWLSIADFSHRLPYSSAKIYAYTPEFKARTYTKGTGIYYK